jgi:anti-sigma factor (TIGR02949 family)
MSCGSANLEPDAQDPGERHCHCDDAISHMDEFVDGEVDAQQQAEISAHLSDCPPCQAQFALEVVVKSLVARSCTEPAPPTLRARVVAQLISARIRIVG